MSFKDDGGAEKLAPPQPAVHDINLEDMMNRNRTHDPEKKGSRRRLDSGQKNASKVSEADDDFKIEGESRIRFGVEDDDDSFVINAGDSNPGSKRPELSGSQKPLSQRVM